MDKIIKQNGVLYVPDNVLIPYTGGNKPKKDFMLDFHEIIDSAVSVAYGGKRKITWREVSSDIDEFTNDEVNIYRDCIVGMKTPLFDTVRGKIFFPGSNLVEKLDLHTCYHPIYYMKGLKTSLKNPWDMNLFLFSGGSDYAYDNIEWEYSRVIESALRFAIKRGMPNITIVHSENISNSMEWAFKIWAYEIADTEYANHTFSMDIYKKLFSVWGEEVANEEMEKARKARKVIIRDESIEDFLKGVAEDPKEYSVIVALGCCGDYISDELTKMVGGAGILPKAYYNYDNSYVLFDSIYVTSFEAEQNGLVNLIPDLLSGIMLLKFMGWHEAADLVKNGLEEDFLYEKPTSNKVSFSQRMAVSKLKGMICI